MQQTEHTKLEGIKTTLDRYKPNNIFLVTGRTSYIQSGAQERLEPLLAPYGVTHFREFEVNPKVRDIKRGIDLFRKNECDLVLAIGGGSALDVAKSINILAMHDGSPEQYVRKELELEHSGAPLIAIPTTAGTGSEATHFAVVYVDKTKYSLAHKTFMLPQYTVLDATLTMSVPSHITAATGMDALCQATESFWSVNSTDESRKYSTQAIELILEHFDAAVNNPTLEARKAMLRGANLAGKGINIAKTTACHSLSYPITSHFGIPHGHAVALTLGEVLLFNATGEGKVIDPRGAEFVHKKMKELVALYGAEDAQGAKKRFNDLMDNVGLERSLEKIGIKDSELIVANGFNPDRMKNNPYLVTEETVREILGKIA